MGYEPTAAELRDGETPDVSGHARRNYELLAGHVGDGVTEEQLAEARERYLGDSGADDE